MKSQYLFFISQTIKTHVKHGISSLQIEDNHFMPLHKLFVLIQQYGVNNSIYVSQLPELTGVLPQAISRYLRLLEKDGLILRKSDPKDRRKVFVKLTEKGIHQHQASFEKIKNYATRIEEEMGHDKMEQFIQLCMNIDQAIVKVNQSMENIK
ncbi:MarR family winged helix-turn-helix transcriptional regulator [Floccifex sp.]|uniref:MarR family winged helix-turn-helix transcriptional regulator n=1 Tax=Floccifex sp. TaxID=2815810 RepID=UPI003F0266D6